VPRQRLPLTAELKAKLERCERAIGYVFQDKDFLLAALTHASGANHRLASNERLEFLGDAILGMVVCELLYHQFPQYLEGDLTRIKSVVVSRETCARISKSLELEGCLILGKGMASQSRVPPSLLADVFESLIAAIYLDGKNNAAREFIETHMGPEVDRAVSGESGSNFKSLLQQQSQKDFGNTPTYRLLDERGPDHSKCFKIAAAVDGASYTPAWGRNKKEAEQKAACNALAEMSGETAPYRDDEI